MNFKQLTIIISVIYLTNGARLRRYRYSLNENDYCGLTPEYTGKCKKMSKCVNLLSTPRNVEVCSFAGSLLAQEMLVCCSREDFYASRKIKGDGILSFKNCMQKYKNLRETSDNFERFVVNGEEVQPYEFSYMAAIGWLRWIDFSVTWNCGGTLITENFVMSAAHCLSLEGRPPNVVRLGDVDLNNPFDDAFVQQFGVADVIVHPHYDYDSNKNDIGLLKLLGTVIPTKNVAPACIDYQQSPEYLQGAGYGQDGDGIPTNKLLKVQLRHVDMTTCQESYSLDLSHDSQMCAKSYRDDQEQDLCYGDSGSALQYMNEDLQENGIVYKTPTVVAVTSFGIGCAFGVPGVYVNVSHYIDWMESVISP